MWRQPPSDAELAAIEAMLDGNEAVLREAMRTHTCKSGPDDAHRVKLLLQACQVLCRQVDQAMGAAGIEQWLQLRLLGLEGAENVALSSPPASQPQDASPPVAGQSKRRKWSQAEEERFARVVDEGGGLAALRAAFPTLQAWQLKSHLQVHQRRRNKKRKKVKIDR